MVLPRIHQENHRQGERNIFYLGVNLFGGQIRTGNRFPLDSHFGTLVGDEIVGPHVHGAISTRVRGDGKENVCYNFEGRDRRIVEKFKESTDMVGVVLFLPLLKKQMLLSC